MPMRQSLLLLLSFRSTNFARETTSATAPARRKSATLARARGIDTLRQMALHESVKKTSGFGTQPFCSRPYPERRRCWRQKPKPATHRTFPSHFLAKPGNKFCAVGSSHPQHQPRPVRFDCSLGKPKLLTDLRVRFALSNERHDLPLTRSEL